MKNSTLTIIFFVAILMTGCLAEVEDDGSTHATAPINATATGYSASPTHPPSTPSTVTTTQTPTPTQLPAETETPTPSPTTMIPRYQCLDIVLDDTTAISSHGVWVLNTEGNNGALLISASNESTPVHLPWQEGDHLSEFDISPDRTRLLYEHYMATTRHATMVIVNAAGEMVWSHPDVDEGNPWGWFDNERLFNLVTQEDDVPYLILLNYATGERQEVRANYPGYTLPFLLEYAFIQEWNQPSAIYDPNLTRVVYGGCTPDCAHGYPVILWDLVNDQEITRLLTMDFFGSYPMWLPDNNHFLIAANLDSSIPLAPSNEFYLVSRDGNIDQLTNLMENHLEVEINPSISLSPNGRYVAFWLRLQSDYYDYRLAVLDIETSQVTNYCLPGETFHNTQGLKNNNYRSYYVETPVWSPDSTQLIIVQRDPEDRSIRWDVLIDLQNEMAIKIGEELDPVGWMISP